MQVARQDVRLVGCTILFRRIVQLLQLTPRGDSTPVFNLSWLHKKKVKETDHEQINRFCNVAPQVNRTSCFSPKLVVPNMF